MQKSALIETGWLDPLQLIFNNCRQYEAYFQQWLLFSGIKK